ncbi:MAG: hypothetical protein JXR07_19310 [Reichenbachiella sp.]
MKAVTNVTKQIIHFSFNDSAVPDHVRNGGKGFCHQLAQTFIKDTLSLKLRYKGKNFNLTFQTLDEEVEINQTARKFVADLKGKISSPRWFIDEVGSDILILEINFSSKAKIEKQAAYRSINSAAIEIYLGDCYSFKNEKYYANYSDDQLDKARLTLQKFITHSNFSFKVLHFPRQRNKRYIESETTRKAKAAFLQQHNKATHPLIKNSKPQEPKIREEQVSIVKSLTPIIEENKESNSNIIKGIAKLIGWLKS